MGRRRAAATNHQPGFKLCVRPVSDITSLICFCSSNRIFPFNHVTLLLPPLRLKIHVKELHKIVLNAICLAQFPSLAIFEYWVVEDCCDLAYTASLHQLRKTSLWNAENALFYTTRLDIRPVITFFSIIWWITAAVFTRQCKQTFPFSKIPFTTCFPWVVMAQH